MPSDYRFSSALKARLMGGTLVLVGVVVLILVALVAVLHLPALVLSVGLVVALVAFLATGLLLTRGGTVVRLDEEGYRVRMVRGAGVGAARWKDVEDVVATTVAGAPCVVLRLRDGRTTTVPVGTLAGDPDAFVRDLQQHLNRGHGYRPLA
ncbi:MAG: hypothetical protein ACXVY4_18375 [Oryzihumus sp.]